MKNTVNLTDLFSVKDYIPPKYPTLLEAKSDPQLLKKIPSRWSKNMRVLTCMGLFGLATITGVGCNYLPRSCDDRGHHGGAGGGGPIYVVYLTEQEALDIIRKKGEKAGLDFSAAPPDNTVTASHIWAGEMTVGIDLFDEENSVAFSYIHDLWRGREFAISAREEFAKQEKDFSVGVFYSPMLAQHWAPPTEEERAVSRKELEEYLTAQVKEFIEWLQADGII